MRALLVATLVFVAALAGCSGKKGGDDDLHYTCTNGTEIHADDYEGVLNETASDNDVLNFLKTKCPKGTGTGNGGNSTGTTSLAPNQLPVLKMNVTDFGGNATMVTILDGNLTFSAEGSMDPDGTISAIAISVTDSNTTRTKSLYNPVTKAFTPAMFSFDRAGPVNVSVQMVDDRAGFNGSQFQVFVNEEVLLTHAGLHGSAAHAEDTPFTDPCRGAAPAFEDTPSPNSGPVVDSSYFKPATFTVSAPPSFIVAKPGDGTLVTICDPDRNPISDTKQSGLVETNNGAVPLAMPSSGTKNYSIGMYADGPDTDASVLVTIHYEPRPAAAAA